jgi:uncharacterized protein (TIGR02145 family)
MKKVILALLAVFLIVAGPACKKNPTSPDNPLETKKPNIEYGAVTDIDGNVYDAVTIGTQTWMTTNLKTTRYGNGDPIPTGLSDTDWSHATYGAYAIYNNDNGNNATYGKLYNFYAVSDSRQLAPAGWHVPTEADWSTLVNYLGGGSIAGGKLKEAGTAHWNSPNEGATNESGFTALPAGQRSWYGPSAMLGDYGYFWSASGGDASGSWGWSMVHSESTVMRLNYTQHCGFSVRCLRN